MQKKLFTDSSIKSAKSEDKMLFERKLLPILLLKSAQPVSANAELI